MRRIQIAAIPIPAISPTIGSGVCVAAGSGVVVDVVDAGGDIVPCVGTSVRGGVFSILSE